MAPPKADIGTQPCHVRFVPGRDIMSAKRPSTNQLLRQSFDGVGTEFGVIADGSNAETPRVSTWLRQIHCEAFEIGKRAMDQGAIVGGTQDHPGRLVCIESFLPAGRT